MSLKSTTKIFFVIDNLSLSLFKKYTLRAHTQAEAIMHKVRYMALKKRPSYDRQPVWSKHFFFLDIDQKEIEFTLTLMDCEADSERIIVLHFFNCGTQMRIPNGIIMTNHMEGEVPFKTVIPRHQQDDHMEMDLDEGFRVLYLGQPLASAPPNIESKRQIMDHRFRADPAQAGKRIVVVDSAEH